MVDDYFSSAHASIPSVSLDEYGALRFFACDLIYVTSIVDKKFVLIMHFISIFKSYILELYYECFN